MYHLIICIANFKNRSILNRMNSYSYSMNFEKTLYSFGGLSPRTPSSGETTGEVGCDDHQGPQSVGAPGHSKTNNSLFSYFITNIKI